MASPVHQGSKNLKFAKTALRSTCWDRYQKQAPVTRNFAATVTSFLAYSRREDFSLFGHIPPSRTAAGLAMLIAQNSRPVRKLACRLRSQHFTARQEPPAASNGRPSFVLQAI